MGRTWLQNAARKVQRAMRETHQMRRALSQIFGATVLAARFAGVPHATANSAVMRNGWLAGRVKCMASGRPFRAWQRCDVTSLEMGVNGETIRY
jgi:hypothetical protein